MAVARYILPIPSTMVTVRPRYTDSFLLCSSASSGSRWGLNTLRPRRGVSWLTANLSQHYGLTFVSTPGWGPERGGSLVECNARTSYDTGDIDEEGMELYLNTLALEYDSVWDTKPAWCQPWTIVLTGAVGIGGSFLLLHNFIVTGVISLLVGIWWLMFLVAYPQSYKEMIAERRRLISSGHEDTFGSKPQP